MMSLKSLLWDKNNNKKAIEIIFLAHVAPLRAASSKDTDTERQTFATHTHARTLLLKWIDPDRHIFVLLTLQKAVNLLKPTSACSGC